MCVYLIVDVAVSEHGVEVLHGLTGTPVIVVLQTFLNGSHVHRVLDHLVVVLELTPASVSLLARQCFLQSEIQQSSITSY